MALSPRLEVRQSQSLTLTPQLMQSIRLLQLSHLELSAFVDAELLRNPLLEREDGQKEAVEEAADSIDLPAAVTAYDDTVAISERVQSGNDIADGLDTAVENLFPEQSGTDAIDPRTPSWAGSAGDGEGGDLEQFAAARPTLAEHLEAQIALLLSDPAERLIARHLVDGLNEAGYLGVAVADVAEQLGVNEDQVTPEAKFIEDLGADSLDTVELVMALEEEFGSEIPDEEAEKLVSVGDVIRYIEETKK